VLPLIQTHLNGAVSAAVLEVAKLTDGFIPIVRLSVVTKLTPKLTSKSKTPSLSSSVLPV
jgi:hypothetical protein